MKIRNYTLLGEEVLLTWARKHTFRSSRLIAALEEFILGGTCTSVAVIASGGVSTREVFLVPAREWLRGVADAAALVDVDYASASVTIFEIIPDYVETDGPAYWQGIVARATRRMQED